MRTKCAITGICCPKTNDPTEKVYCPHWVDGIMETENDGSGRFVCDKAYNGCFLNRLPQYLVSIAAGAGHAAASYDKAHTFLEKAKFEPALQSLVAIAISTLAGSRSEQSANSQHQLHEGNKK